MRDTYPEPPPSVPPVRQRPLTDRRTWIRILYMILFGMVLNVLGFVLGLVAFVQACALIATGEPFREISAFGSKLADYTRHVVAFLALSTDEVPYPFAPDASPPPERPRGGDSVRGDSFHGVPGVPGQPG